MSTVAWVIAGILALDLLIVVGFVAVEVVGRRRVSREISHLNALWRAPARSPARPVRVGAGAGTEGPPEREGRTGLVVRSVTAPRTIGTVAFVTALVAMLVMGVVASIGGEDPGRRTITRAERSGNTSQHGSRTSRGDSEATPTGAVRPSPTGTPHGDPSYGTPGSSPPSNAGFVPAKVSAQAASSGSIVVVWTEVPGASEYRVERKDQAQAWGLLGSTSAGQTSYRDSTVESATTYFYRVRAVIENDPAPPSDVISATTPVEPPPSPTSVTAAANSSTEIALSWSDVGGETGYRIERQLPGGSWEEIATAGADITAYTDGGLTPETTYSYRVFAVNEGGDSEASEVVDATTLPPPGPAESPQPGTGTGGIDAPGKSKGNPDKPHGKDDTTPPDASATG